MSKKEKTLLNSKIMKEMLIELGDTLQARGKIVNIGIYRGAVMCMEYELRITSYDIDCIYSDEIVRTLALDMAKKHNIQTDWLNDAIRDIVSEDMKTQEMYKVVQFGG